jgi:hypothetical protein
VSFATWRRHRTIQPQWSEGLNFAGPRVAVSFWSWALLALGLIAVVHASDLILQHDEALLSAQAEQERLQSHARRADRTLALSSSAVGEPPGAPVLSADAWSSAAQLAAWLNHPWAPCLDHADASARQRGVALTRFQLDLAAWGVRAQQPLPWRLQAAVIDDASALAWLQDLGPDAGLQRRDALAQPAPGERGALQWRIDVAPMGAQP